MRGQSLKAQNVLIIGPPTVGKTCFLAAAHLAANLTAFENPTVSMIPRNSAMISLLDRARRTILTGSMDDQIVATPSTTRYEFDLRITKQLAPSGFWKTPRDETLIVKYCFLDGPGGALLPMEESRGEFDQADINTFRDELINHGRSSQGLLLCVDSHNVDLAKSFFLHLPTLFANLGTAPLHFRRIAILLTKSDLYARKARRNAAQLLRETNPWKLAFELLTRQTLGHMLGLTGPSTDFACGWCSAYGFIENEGTANFDRENNRLRTFVPEHEHNTIDSWKPYRVLDPLLFLATGDHRSMQVVCKSQLIELGKQLWTVT